MSDLDAVKRSISVTLDEILATKRALAAKGIDASDPDDREAYDIVCRIQRRLNASNPTAKINMPIDQPPERWEDVA